MQKLAFMNKLWAIKKRHTVMITKSNDLVNDKIRNIRLIIICSFILFSNSVFSQNNLQLTRLNASCDTAIIRTWVWFPFGYQSTCPTLSGFTTSNNSDTLELKLFYNTSGAWPQAGCERANTIVFSISTTNTILKGQSYSITDNDTSLVSGAFIGLCNLTSISSIDVSNKYSIFPNPTNNMINLQSESWPKGNKTIILTDLNGKVIKSFATDQQVISLLDIAAGQYIITVFTNKNEIITTQRILKIE
jgi:hypothetical protein